MPMIEQFGLSGSNTKKLRDLGTRIFVCKQPIIRAGDHRRATNAAAQLPQSRGVVCHRRAGRRQWTTNWALSGVRRRGRTGHPWRVWLSDAPAWTRRWAARRAGAGVDSSRCAAPPSLPAAHAYWCTCGGGSSPRPYSAAWRARASLTGAGALHATREGRLCRSASDA